jgi:hypothetical protein
LRKIHQCRVLSAGPISIYQVEAFRTRFSHHQYSEAEHAAKTRQEFQAAQT